MATTGISQRIFKKSCERRPAANGQPFLDCLLSRRSCGSRDIAMVAAPKYESFAEGEAAAIAAAKPEQRSV